MPHVFLLYEFLPETPLARGKVAEWISALDAVDGVPASEPIAYRTSVEVFDCAAVTGRLRRETNDVYLAD
jgi:hypothetical protein